jgi:hypothetical protein
MYVFTWLSADELACTTSIAGFVDRLAGTIVKAVKALRQELPGAH